MKRSLACLATVAILIAGCTTAGSAPSQSAGSAGQTPGGSANALATPEPTTATVATPVASTSISDAALTAHLVAALDTLQPLVTGGGDTMAWILAEGQWGADNMNPAMMSLPGVLAYSNALIALMQATQDGVDTGPAIVAMLATRPALAATNPSMFGTPQPVATPPKPVVVKGSGSRKTTPFAMPGGDFTVKITGKGDGNVIADLMPRGGSVLDGDFLFNEIAYAKYTYTTVIYGVEAGSYYLDVTNRNAWVVTFTPLP